MSLSHSTNNSSYVRNIVNSRNNADNSSKVSCGVTTNGKSINGGSATSRPPRFTATATIACAAYPADNTSNTLPSSNKLSSATALEKRPSVTSSNNNNNRWKSSPSPPFISSSQSSDMTSSSSALFGRNGNNNTLSSAATGSAFSSVGGIRGWKTPTASSDSSGSTCSSTSSSVGPASSASSAATSPIPMAADVAKTVIMGSSRFAAPVKTTSTEPKDINGHQNGKAGNSVAPPPPPPPFPPTSNISKKLNGHSQSSTTNKFQANGTNKQFISNTNSLPRGFNSTNYNKMPKGFSSNATLAANQIGVTANTLRRTESSDPSSGGVAGKPKVDPSDPQVRKLVYNMYRGLLDKKHDHSNSIISNLPNVQVEHDEGVKARVLSMMKQQEDLKSGKTGAMNGPCGPPPPPPPPPFTVPGMTPPPAPEPVAFAAGPIAPRAPAPRPAPGPQMPLPPAALAGAMMKDRKPFTYTPGGLDLSEIRSPRMQRRLSRNAACEGQKPSPLALQNAPNSPTPGSNSPSVSSGIAVQVLPMPGMAMNKSASNQSSGATAKKATQPVKKDTGNSKEPPAPKSVCGPPPPPPPFQISGSTQNGSQCPVTKLPEPKIPQSPTSPPTQVSQATDTALNTPSSPPFSSQSSDPRSPSLSLASSASSNGSGSKSIPVPPPLPLQAPSGRRGSIVLGPPTPTAQQMGRSPLQQAQLHYNTKSNQNNDYENDEEKIVDDEGSYGGTDHSRSTESSSMAVEDCSTSYRENSMTPSTASNAGTDLSSKNYNPSAASVNIVNNGNFEQHYSSNESLLKQISSIEHITAKHHGKQECSTPKSHSSGLSSSVGDAADQQKQEQIRAQAEKEELLMKQEEELMRQQEELRLQQEMLRKQQEELRKQQEQQRLKREEEEQRRLEQEEIKRREEQQKLQEQLDQEQERLIIEQEEQEKQRRIQEEEENRLIIEEEERQQAILEEAYRQQQNQEQIRLHEEQEARKRMEEEQEAQRRMEEEQEAQRRMEEEQEAQRRMEEEQENQRRIQEEQMRIQEEDEKQRIQEEEKMRIQEEQRRIQEVQEQQRQIQEEHRRIQEEKEQQRLLYEQQGKMQEEELRMQHEQEQQRKLEAEQQMLWQQQQQTRFVRQGSVPAQSNNQKQTTNQTEVVTGKSPNASPTSGLNKAPLPWMCGIPRRETSAPPEFVNYAQNAQTRLQQQRSMRQQPQDHNSRIPPAPSPVFKEAVVVSPPVVFQHPGSEEFKPQENGNFTLPRKGKAGATTAAQRPWVAKHLQYQQSSPSSQTQQQKTQRWPQVQPPNYLRQSSLSNETISQSHQVQTATEAPRVRIIPIMVEQDSSSDAEQTYGSVTSPVMRNAPTQPPSYNTTHNKSFANSSPSYRTPPLSSSVGSQPQQNCNQPPVSPPTYQQSQQPKQFYQQPQTQHQLQQVYQQSQQPQQMHQQPQSQQPQQVYQQPQSQQPQQMYQQPQSQQQQQVYQQQPQSHQPQQVYQQQQSQQPQQVYQQPQPQQVYQQPQSQPPQANQVTNRGKEPPSSAPVSSASYNTPVGLYSDGNAVEALQQMQQSLAQLNSGLQNAYPKFIQEKISNTLPTRCETENSSGSVPDGPPMQSRSFRILQNVVDSEASDSQGPGQLHEGQSPPQQQRMPSAGHGVSDL